MGYIYIYTHIYIYIKIMMQHRGGGGADSAEAKAAGRRREKRTKTPPPEKHYTNQGDQDTRGEVYGGSEELLGTNVSPPGSDPRHTAEGALEGSAQKRCDANRHLFDQFFKFVDLCRQCCGTRDKHEKGQDEAQTKYVRDHTRPTQRSEGRERKGNEQEWLRDGSVGTDGAASGDRSEGRDRGRTCPSSGARIYGQQWDRARRLSRVAQPRAPEADTLRWLGPAPPTQPVCEIPFDNATTNESLMDPKREDGR